jgi:hypothetical protein
MVTRDGDAPRKNEQEGEHAKHRYGEDEKREEREVVPDVEFEAHPLSPVSF